MLLLFVSQSFVKWPDILFWIVVGAFFYGLIMPLLVSAYVYDLSGYYDMHWMKDLITDQQKANRIVNINAGSTYWEIHLPFGGGSGTKSGIGRLGGRLTLEAMTELKMITITRTGAGAK